MHRARTGDAVPPPGSENNNSSSNNNSITQPPGSPNQDDNPPPPRRQTTFSMRLNANLRELHTHTDHAGLEGSFRAIMGGIATSQAGLTVAAVVEQEQLLAEQEAAEYEAQFGSGSVGLLPRHNNDDDNNNQQHQQQQHQQHDAEAGGGAAAGSSSLADTRRSFRRTVTFANHLPAGGGLGSTHSGSLGGMMRAPTGGFGLMRTPSAFAGGGSGSGNGSGAGSIGALSLTSSTLTRQGTSSLFSGGAGATNNEGGGGGGGMGRRAPTGGFGMLRTPTLSVAAQLHGSASHSNFDGGGTMTRAPTGGGGMFRAPTRVVSGAAPAGCGMGRRAPTTYTGGSGSGGGGEGSLGATITAAAATTTGGGGGMGMRAPTSAPLGSTHGGASFSLGSLGRVTTGGAAMGATSSLSAGGGGGGGGAAASHSSFPHDGGSGHGSGMGARVGTASFSHAPNIAQQHMVQEEEMVHTQTVNFVRDACQEYGDLSPIEIAMLQAERDAQEFDDAAPVGVTDEIGIGAAELLACIELLNEKEFALLAEATHKQSEESLEGHMMFSGASWYTIDVMECDPDGPQNGCEWNEQGGLTVALCGYSMTFPMVSLLLRGIFLISTWFFLWLALDWKKGTGLMQRGGAIFDSVIVFLLSSIMGGIIGRIFGMPPLLFVLLWAIMWANIPSFGYLTSGISKNIRDLTSRVGLAVILIRSGLAMSWKTIKPAVFNISTMSILPMLGEILVHGFMATAIMDYGGDKLWPFLQAMMTAPTASAVVGATTLLLRTWGFGSTRGPGLVMLPAVVLDMSLGILGVTFVASLVFAAPDDNMGWIIGKGPVQVVVGIIAGIILGYAWYGILLVLFSEAKVLPHGRYARAFIRRTSNIALFVLLLFGHICVFFGYSLKAAGGGSLGAVMVAATANALLTGEDSPEHHKMIKTKMYAKLSSSWELLVMPALFSLAPSSIDITAMFGSGGFLGKAIGCILCGAAARILIAFLCMLSYPMTTPERIVSCFASAGRATVQVALASLPLSLLAEKAGATAAEKRYAQQVQDTAILGVLIFCPFAIILLTRVAPRYWLVDVEFERRRQRLIRQKKKQRRAEKQEAAAAAHQNSDAGAGGGDGDSATEPTRTTTTSENAVLTIEQIAQGQEENSNNNNNNSSKPDPKIPINNHEDEEGDEEEEEEDWDHLDPDEIEDCDELDEEEMQEIQAYEAAVYGGGGGGFDDDFDGGRGDGDALLGESGHATAGGGSATAGCDWGPMRADDDGGGMMMMPCVGGNDDNIMDDEFNDNESSGSDWGPSRSGGSGMTASAGFSGGGGGGGGGGFDSNQLAAAPSSSSSVQQQQQGGAGGTVTNRSGSASAASPILSNGSAGGSAASGGGGGGALTAQRLDAQNKVRAVLAKIDQTKSAAGGGASASPPQPKAPGKKSASSTNPASSSSSSPPAAAGAAMNPDVQSSSLEAQFGSLMPGNNNNNNNRRSPLPGRFAGVSPAAGASRDNSRAPSRQSNRSGDSGPTPRHPDGDDYYINRGSRPPSAGRRGGGITPLNRGGGITPLGGQGGGSRPPSRPGQGLVDRMHALVAASHDPSGNYDAARPPSGGRTGTPDRRRQGASQQRRRRPSGARVEGGASGGARAPTDPFADFDVPMFQSPSPGGATASSQGPDSHERVREEMARLSGAGGGGEAADAGGAAAASAVPSPKPAPKGKLNFSDVPSSVVDLDSNGNRGKK